MVVLVARQRFKLNKAAKLSHRTMQQKVVTISASVAQNRSITLNYKSLILIPEPLRNLYHSQLHHPYKLIS